MEGVQQLDSRLTYHPNCTLVPHNLDFLTALSCPCFQFQKLQQVQNLKAELEQKSLEEATNSKLNIDGLNLTLALKLVSRRMLDDLTSLWTKGGLQCS